MAICQMRSIALQGIKHFQFATDLIITSHYRSAIRELDQVPEAYYEVAYDVAFNKSHCWEKLKCYNNALDEAIRCLLIDKHSSSGYFRTGRLLHRKKRFFEAEHCLIKSLQYSQPGDMLTVYLILKAVNVNMRSAITASGFESDMAELACHLYRRLHDAAAGLQSGEAFRQKHIWSCSYVTEPVIQKDEKRLTGG
jgi:tetratricopeptide (TPR) repeat protein